jgi:hypothetical protein
MFEFRFDSATKTRLLVKLQGMSPRFVSVVTTKLRALMFQLQSKIVAEKLSGQVLHRRTGILAGSVHTLPVTTTENTISGGVASSSGPAFYGRIHESVAAALIKFSQSRAARCNSCRDPKRSTPKILCTHQRECAPS